MRPESIVLLVAAALLACVDGASVATTSKTTTAAFPRSVADNQDIISTKRSLRISKEQSQADEERSSIDKITGLVKPGASKFVDNTSLKSWLRKDKMDPNLIWKKLGLEEVTKAKALSELKNPETEAFLKNVVAALLNKRSIEVTVTKLAKNNNKNVEGAVKRLEAGL
ncbi:hypothetical protein PF008_g26330 [Phytophthora fragariae]|uniref:RxLR effector protein n=1 Tax=Phytophthora fragariae TaxID=53985 RepID=A0A6G0QI41_9STRA|nr:hypothetical protein PF008_g26330 [Phytophthora fragariae]